MKKNVLKIGFKICNFFTIRKQILFIILLLISISVTLKSEESFQWVKGDSIWKMNSTIPLVLEAKLLGTDRFVTYSVDSIIRIWNLDSGNLLNSYKVNEKYTDFKFCESAEYFVLSDIQEYGIFNYNILIKLFETETGNIFAKGLVDNNFLRSHFVGPPVLALFAIKVSYSYFNNTKNELLYGINFSEGGSEYQYTISGASGSLICFKKVNDSLVIQNGIAGGHLSRMDDRNGLSYFLSWSSLSKTHNEEVVYSFFDDYYYSMDMKDFKLKDIFKAPVTIKGIYIRDLDINFESKLNDLSYIFYKKNEYPQLNGFIKLPENNIANADVIEIPTNITPYYLTNNDQYIISYVNNYQTQDIVGFFSPLSKKCDISFPADPESGYNFIKGNNKKNLVLHISNTNNVAFLKVYNLNNIMKELDISADKYKIPIGDKVKMAAFMNTKGKDYKWYVNGMQINQTGSEIEYQPQSPGFYDIELFATDEIGTVHEVTKKKFIEVQDSLIADFKLELLNDQIPLKVQFTNISRGSFTNWNWDFGDGSLISSEQNPVHEYNFPGDFSPRLIVSNDITSDTVTKFEKILIRTPETEEVTPIISSKENTDNKTFRNVFLSSDGFVIGHKYVVNTYKNPTYDSYVAVDYKHFDFGFNTISKFSGTLYNRSWTDPLPESENGYLEFILNDKNTLGIMGRYDIIYDHVTSFYDLKTGKMLYYESIPSFYFLIIPKKIYNYSDSTFNWILVNNSNCRISKTDLKINSIWTTKLSDRSINNCYSDTLKNSTQVLNKYNSSDYEMFSVTNDGNILYSKSFKLDTNITLLNIKSVNENLILLHGCIIDKVNNTTYAYLAKFNPIDNTIIDTILYSRQNIKKIEKINNQYFAAVGQNRCRQGYLIIDTNLHQIKDIRVVDLTGTMQECIVHNSKVYLFTEKIASVPTQALTYINSYQTTSSVLDLPADILADVEEHFTINNNGLDFSIYPNPSGDYIDISSIIPTLKRGVDEFYDIQIFDILGEIVLSVEQTSPSVQRIDISNLAPGIYFIKIGNRVEKFVKI